MTKRIVSSSLALLSAIALTATASAGGKQEKNIVEIAAGAGQFNTLVAAVKAAGLAETLQGSGPFTVFAPTDAAFAKLPEGTVESLLKPENKERLVALLENHLTLGRIYMDQAAKLGRVPMIGRGVVPISFTEQGATIGGGTIVVTDIEAATRFCLEVAKSFGRGSCAFFDVDEFARLEELYGSMRHLQTLGREV